ncbi:hypothetical protein A7X86_06335 [Stenotrophomonas maltophilia]|uniref:hypothetical protein n=1 Tax=Stenotrophomonas maltophilia TaxID=40324 RepID=UPI000DAA03E8|nr:hypothetical protein [Stenotrophomonas maltophilia]PZT21404.1 hypothetical protein A7X86_06335 [Stenotrophomonas maltophilia]
MSIVRRTFKSTPGRDASETWRAISELLLRNGDGSARTELEAVAGIATSLIADQAPRDAPITVICSGPRTRIYCLYDDDAIGGEDVNEEGVGFDPLKGEWSISLPCPADDLSWAQRALAEHSKRITARDLSDKQVEAAASSTNSSVLTLDTKGFLA